MTKWFIVYFLTVEGSGIVSYVGCTEKPERERLARHKSQVIRDRTLGGGALSKMEAMRKWRQGDITVKIITVYKTRSKKDALEKERTLIAILNPEWNGNGLRRTIPPLVIRSKERMLSYREAASDFNYSYQTIRFLVCSGKVRHIGQRIPVSEMIRYDKSKMITGRPKKKQEAPV